MSSDAGGRRTQDFLAAVLAPGGSYVLALKKPDWKGFRHVLFDDLARLAQAASVTAAQGFDAYFALSTFARPADPKDFAREQVAALGTRSLVIDADVKADDERFPASKDEARELLGALTAKLALPDPILVDSGGGIHAYWPLEQAVKSEQWKQLGAAFKAAVRELEPKLAADPTRMADSAGVLRVPGTINNKRQRGVELVAWSDGQLPLAEAVRILRPWLKPAAPAKPKAPLVNLAVEEPPRLLNDVVRGCKWMREYTRRVAVAPEPEWYAVLGLAKHLYADHKGTTLEGREIAHLLSKGHPGYSVEETDRKFDQVSVKQTGPTMCARFRDVRPEGCKDCPLADKVVTPLHVTNFLVNGHGTHKDAPKAQSPAAPSATSVPSLPFPFFHDAKKGGIWLQQKDAEGKRCDEEVTPYNLFLTGRSVPEDGAGEHLIKMMFLSPKDGPFHFTLPSSLLADPKALAKTLNGYSVYTKQKGFDMLLHYIYRCAQHMQQAQVAEQHVSRFGWRRDRDDAIETFSFGREQMILTGQMVTCECSPTLDDNHYLVETKGELEKWKAAFDVYTHVPNSEPQQFAALSAFGAPLLEFTEYRGVIYNMVGPSGSGKSTSLQLMTSVWGKPSENHMMKADTENSMPNQLGMMNSLPVAFDEITNIAPERLSDFCLWLTQGRGKRRATKTGDLARQNQRWSTMVVATSNASLYEKLFQFRRGFAGEAMRVFEVQAPRAEKENKPVIDKALLTVKRNHGLAGRVFIQGLLRGGLEKVRDAVATQLERLTREFKLGPDERFWAAAIASTYVGGLLASKLGLHSYDMEKVMKWAMDMIDVVRQQVKGAQQGAGRIIADYINENLSTAVVMQDGNVDQIYAAGRRLPRISCRLEYEGPVLKACVIPCNVLMQWARDKRIDTNWLKQVMTEEGLLQRAATVRIAAGTGLVLPGVQSYILDPAAFVEDAAALKESVLAEVEKAS